MKKISTIALVLILTWSKAFSQSWSLVGCNDQTKTDIAKTAAFVSYTAMSANNTYYMSFIDDMTGSNNVNDFCVHIKKFNTANNQWENVGGAATPSFPASDFFPIACNNNDIFMAYAEPFATANAGKISVKKFNTSNNQWEFVGAPAFSAAEAGGISLTAANNKLYVAYTDALLGDKLTVKSFDLSNPSQGWITLGSGISQGAAANIVGSGTIIKVAANNELYVAYLDLSLNGGNGGTMLTKYNGTTWSNVGNSIISGIFPGYSPDLAFDNSNNPYVSYVDPVDRRVVVKTFSAGSWNAVGTLPALQNFVMTNSLLFVNNQPYVAYAGAATANGTLKANVRKYVTATNTWEAVGTNPVSQVATGTGSDVVDVVLEKDNTGKLYLNYHAMSLEIYSRVFNTNGPLPVSFVSFTAEKKLSDALLKWSTTNEVNNAFFEIEYSIDGRNFSKAGTVAAANNGSVANSYSFMVKDLTAGKYYFRIKQVDKDGQFDYSKTITLEIDNKVAVSLYPNPVKDQLNIYTAKNIYNTAYIINSTGKILKTITLTASTTQVDVSSLSTGIYFVRLTNEKSSGETLSFIK